MVCGTEHVLTLHRVALARAIYAVSGYHVGLVYFYILSVTK